MPVEITTDWRPLARKLTQDKLRRWVHRQRWRFEDWSVPRGTEVEVDLASDGSKPFLSLKCPYCKATTIDIHGGDIGNWDEFPGEIDAYAFFGRLGYVYMMHGGSETFCVDTERVAKHLLGSTATPGVDFERVQLERAINGGVEWLIPDVMERGKLASLFGPPKAGKSLLALQWAVKATSEFSVVYLDEENDPGEVVARLEAMGIDMADVWMLDYRSFTGWTVDTQEGADAILKMCQGADLVIFDSWAKFFAGASQNDDAAANRAYNLTIKPLRKAGVGILRLDHSGHGEVTRPAGSIQKLADVDHNWQIKAKPLDGDRAEVTLVHRDNRTNRGPKTINLMREVGPLRHVERGQEVAPEPDESVSDDPVLALVSLMDDKGWPTDWPVRACREELQKLGQGVKQDVLAAAVRARKASGVTTA
jgi:hypothetical protein